MATLRASNGWEFDVQPVTPDDPSMEAPFRLVRTNGRAPFKGRAYRLIRNQPRPELCFPVPETDILAEKPVNIWFKISPGGELLAA